MVAYAITDPSTLDFNTLEKDLVNFCSKASMIVYRDKNTLEYASNAKKFLKYTHSFEQVLLHGDYILAKKLGADGVHLKSTQFTDIQKAKDLELFVVISTHTLEEAKKAERLGADMLTYSPVFPTPNKSEAVGLSALKNVVESVAIPVLALGGMVTQVQIDACVAIGAEGFASIRYFKKV
ncbi:MAG TPA: thiamine phosphate synthase [Epsilonproteobacteria bacterium]|nr:thiamine phosphate synthase [Campylobacterota bacterium]